MAKKRKGSRRRRSRVGALNPKSSIVMGAAVLAGYFMGTQINAAVDKVLPASLSAGTGIMGYLPTIAEAGIGSFLLMKGRPSIVKAAIGGVLLGAGLQRGLKKAGIVSGYQSVPVLGGYQSVPVLGAIPPQLQGYRVNGMPPQLQGYRVNGRKSVMGNSGGSGSGYTSDCPSSGYRS